MFTEAVSFQLLLFVLCIAGLLSGLAMTVVFTLLERRQTPSQKPRVNLDHSVSYKGDNKEHHAQ